MLHFPAYGDLLGRLALSPIAPGEEPPPPETVLRSLWFAAAGIECPPERVCKEQLPLLDDEEKRQLLQWVEERAEGRPLPELVEV